MTDKDIETGKQLLEEPFIKKNKEWMKVCGAVAFGRGVHELGGWRADVWGHWHNVQLC
jgi:hypothetical protein